MSYTREQIDAFALELESGFNAEIGAAVRQLLAENDALKSRLEIDPRHPIDGIAARDATIKAQDELIDALREDAERNKVDADCFRWWVHEAAANPALVAKAICHCVTEDEYRAVICGAMNAKDAVIYAARKKG